MTLGLKVYLEYKVFINMSKEYDSLMELLMDTNHEKGFDVDLIMCDGTKIRKIVKAIAIPSKINHAMIINDMSPENALN